MTDPKAISGIFEEIITDVADVKSEVKVLSSGQKNLEKKVELIEKQKAKTVKGEPGEPGEPGLPGVPGKKGDKGDPGYTPRKGVDYFDGKDGKDGKDAEINEKLISDVVEECFKRKEKLEDEQDAKVVTMGTSYGGRDKRYYRKAEIDAMIAAIPGGGGASNWGDLGGILSNQTDLQDALDAKADALGSDDNYVTDAEKTVIGNTSGTNTGDQESSDFDHGGLQGLSDDDHPQYAFRLNLTTQDDDYTASAGDLVLADLSTKSIEVTLPAVADDARIGIKLGTASGTRTVTITPDGTDEIDGQTSIILYVENDYIELQGNATDGQWIVVEDGVQPHMARFRRALSDQTITDNTSTAVEFDTMDYNVGGIGAANGSTAGNDGVTIRRGGKYSINGHIRIPGIDANELVRCSIYINGSEYTFGYNYSTTTNLVLTASVTATLDLSPGDVVTLWVTQNSGDSQILSNFTTATQTYMEVIEQRGGGHGSGGAIPLSEVWVWTGNGHGSTNNKIRRFSTQAVNIGAAITYTDSASAGASFTINQDGLYSISYSDRYLSGTTNIGISINSSSLTTSVISINPPELIATVLGGTNASTPQLSIVKRLSAGNVIRPHTDGNPNGTGNSNQFHIIKIGN